MFCQKCGVQNTDDAKFCQNCGTMINEVVNVNQGAVPPGNKPAFSPPPAPPHLQIVPPPDPRSSLQPPPPNGQMMGQYSNQGFQGTSVPLQYAHFGRRFVAAFIDGAMLTVMMSAVGALVGFIFPIKTQSGMQMMMIVMNVVQFALGWFYFAHMESSASCGTFGKSLMGIKVTDLNGNRVTFGRATKRYFAKIPSAMIFLIGYIMAAFTEKRQALHDKMAGCLVIRKL